MKPAQFPAAIDKEIADLRRFMAGIPERDLPAKKVTMPWGAKLPLGQAMAIAPARFVAGYRMQLFLYAKASGNKKLATGDCCFEAK